MARLPEYGEQDWGKILENFLKQSLDHSGQLVSGPTNPHTGGVNTNLADASRAGLVQLTGDLSNEAHNPTVTGLQGKPVASIAPTHGQTLVWNAKNGQWEPGSLVSSTAIAQAMSMSSMRI